MNPDISNLKEVGTSGQITVADSFVIKANKIGSAAGEAKLYIGHDSSSLWNFYGAPGFILNCFMRRSDLIKLLDDLKGEYFSPTQVYRNSDGDLLKRLWTERYKKISSLDEIVWFECFEQEQIRGVRVYIKSPSPAFKLLRELSLPNLTMIAFVKLQDVMGNDYFRIKPYAKN